MGGETSKISGDELRTLRDSTSYSGDEINEWYSKFRKDCPEGSMTREQFMNMYSQIFPNGDVRQFAEHIFKSYDIDGNGTIDFKEFLCTMSVASRGAIDEKLTWAFRLYDLDGNGYVTEKECVEIIKSIYKMRGMSQKASKGNMTPQEATEEIFKQLDRNNDKKLTEFEFVQGAKNSPTILGILQNIN